MMHLSSLCSLSSPCTYDIIVVITVFAVTRCSILFILFQTLHTVTITSACVGNQPTGKLQYSLYCIRAFPTEQCNMNYSNCILLAPTVISKGSTLTSFRGQAFKEEQELAIVNMVIANIEIKLKEILFDCLQRVMELETNQVPHNIIYIDEAGFNLAKKRGRDRNIIGKRATVAVPGQRGANITICAAISNNGVLLHKSRIGTYITERLLQFLDELYDRLVPEAERGQGEQGGYICHHLGQCGIPPCTCSHSLV